MYRPANPTQITKITFTPAVDISKGTPVTVNLANAGYHNVYDCTTWEYYWKNPTYDYVGYFASSHSVETETKTILTQSGSTAMQNFAFDGMDDVYE